MQLLATAYKQISTLTISKKKKNALAPPQQEKKTTD